MSVVAADGEYVKPFNTTVLMISPGQSTDVLVTADQAVGEHMGTSTPSLIACYQKINYQEIMTHVQKVCGVFVGMHFNSTDQSLAKGSDLDVTHLVSDCSSQRSIVT